MSTAISARERFLRNASKTLQENSPGAAAALRHEAQLIQILAGAATQSNSISEDCCRACGSLNTDVRVVDSPATCRSDGTPIKIRKCQDCSRSVKSLITGSAPTDPGRSTVPVPEKQAPEGQDVQLVTAPSVSKITKMSSKKRARERKDREGLKALLDKRKNEDASARESETGFSLADFISSSAQK